MDEQTDSAALAAVERNFAVNVREYRDQIGLSQDELAQRMTERGFGFTQATVWKIEQGKRAVRIAEAVALMDALGLPSWMHLTRSPHTFRLDAQLQAAHRRAGAAYTAIKDATTAFLHAQAEVAFAAYEAREADIAVDRLWTSWLTQPAERAVIEARIDDDRLDTVRKDLDRTVDTIMAAIRAGGYEPIIDLDTIETTGPDATTGKHGATATG
ncbi:MAG: helix-turn-helix domain-containing protein [Pseudonocardia sp.]